MKISILPTELCGIFDVICCISVLIETSALHLHLSGPEACPHANMPLMMPLIWLKYMRKNPSLFLLSFYFCYSETQSECTAAFTVHLSCQPLMAESSERLLLKPKDVAASRLLLPDFLSSCLCSV